MSKVGLIDGGSMPKPGEKSQAYQRVLFIDELSEASRRCSRCCSSRWRTER
jgi:predicted ATPase with chaperone activity